MMTKAIFAERDKNLKMLGFDSYEEYLASDLWSWVRSTALKSIDDKCECCLTTTGLCLHHRDYSLPVLCGNFSNADRRIVRMCSKCHKAIHCDGKQWFDLLLVDERFQTLVGRRCFVRLGSFTRDGLPTSFAEVEEFAVSIARYPGGDN